MSSRRGIKPKLCILMLSIQLSSFFYLLVMVLETILGLHAITFKSEVNAESVEIYCKHTHRFISP
jgi:hypothetical protein